MHRPQVLWLEIAGRPVHVESWAPRQLRVQRPVVLVHGLGGSTVNWHASAPRFAERLGRRVVAVDLPGFGLTPPLRDGAGLDGARRVVAGVLEDLGPALLVGNSMGAAVALGPALRRPELVDALVLIGPVLPLARAESWRDRLAIQPIALAGLPFVGSAAAEWRVRSLGPERLVDATLRAVCARPDELDRELRRRLVELAERRHDMPHAGRAYHEAVRSLAPHVLRHLGQELDAIGRPTLVVHGAHDRLVPVGLARAATRRRDWRFELFADCGHVPHMEAPERLVAAVAAWLDEPAPAEPGED